MGIAGDHPTAPQLMPQTLLALCAILMFSFFALSQHSAKADTERFAITAEVEMAAGRIARQRLATVLAKDFDEVDVGVTRVRTSPTGLSAIGPDNADGEEAIEADYDDVDDFDGSSVLVTSDWMGQSLEFASEVSVRYVRMTATGIQGSSAKEVSKEVSVTVRAAPAGFVGTPEIAATLSQIVTPTSN